MIKIKMANKEGVRVKSDYDTFGFAIFASTSGAVYHLTHAYRDGELEVEPSQSVDFIICCHPQKVASCRNGDGAKVVGDWAGETRILFFESSVRVLERRKELRK